MEVRLLLGYALLALFALAVAYFIFIRSRKGREMRRAFRGEGHYKRTKRPLDPTPKS